MTVPLAPCAPPRRTTAPARRTGAADTPALGAVTTAFHRLLYLLTALPLGALWLALLITGWVLVLVSAITPLLPAVLIAFGTAVRFTVWIEGYLARRLLGAPVAPRRLATGHRSYWGSVGGVLGDRRFWAGQAFLLLRFVLGLVTAVVVLSVLAAALEGVFAPVVHPFIPTEDGRGIDLGFWLVDTFRESILLVPVGLVLLAWGIGLLHGCAALWRLLATRLLGVAAMMADVVRAATPDPIVPADLRRAAVVTAAASGAIVALLAVIWALTTRGRFWPIWPALALAFVTGLISWVAWVLSNPPARTRVSTGVTITAGVYGCLILGLVAIWALTGGYFWPVWVALALGVVLGVHALVAHTVQPVELQQRIDTLTVTRARAIDAQEAELRRIERDLHDGAQARLVALGMTIGLAEQRLDTDPEGARRLLDEAKSGAHDALEELRDLARGIRPPVLQDRGLIAAMSELAARSPIDVRVDAEVRDLPPAIESAAYFVVAEALANATKHAGPNRVDVLVRRDGDWLTVEVRDDGAGGADPDGTGLRGLRARVEALDGRFLLTSPLGGPTTVRGELPCAS